MPADLADRTDFENARRGVVARRRPGVVTGADGRVVDDADRFLTVEGDTKVFDTVLGLTDQPDPSFAIATP